MHFLLKNWDIPACYVSLPAGVFVQVFWLVGLHDPLGTVDGVGETRQGDFEIIES